MRNSLFSLVTSDALTAKKEEWPTIKKESSLIDLMDLSKDTRKAYSFMCKVILPCVVGKTRWAKKCHDMQLQKWVAKVDEGFGILVLTNYWEKWWAMVEGDDDAVKSIRTKWTDEGRGANARMNGGWSREGRSEFGNICKLVMEDRKGKNEQEKEIRMSFRVGFA